jgi:FXSXX-COOH protein
MSEDPLDVKQDIDTDMLDLAGLSLNDLERLNSSSLGHALRRVVDRAGETVDPVVGFQSSI